MLAPTSDSGALPVPEDVKSVTFSGRVLLVRDGVAYVRYEGEIAAEHPYNFEPYVGQGKVTRGWATFVAMGACDAQTGALLSFTLVADCNFRHVNPGADVLPYAVAVEWRRQRP
jgi:hypothetical protein